MDSPTLVSTELAGAAKLTLGRSIASRVATAVQGAEDAVVLDGSKAYDIASKEEIAGTI